MKINLSIILAATTAHAFAATLTPQQSEFFETRIRPVLAQDCYECHSTATKKKGGLLLDSRAGWQAGGESGDVIKPGDAKGSLLIQTIRHEHEDLKMPKAGAKLEAKVVADFEKWINEGALDPRDKPPTKEQVAKETDWKTILERRKDWWAFKPVQSPKVDGGNANPIDVLIDASLKAQGLSAAPQADAAVIVRRLYYVLTGLPPSADELEAGSKDLAGTIDKLLASPRYGERWARHWMDWVRYAESYGSEGDPAIPYAWRYRDYLIRAFNTNVPYPQMLREAIAGDLLPAPRINNELGLNESALGIGQLRMVMHGFSPVDTLDEMVSFTDNQIDVVSKAFQAMTVTCARCHNHKFDPISQTDFYSMYGIFTSTHPAVIDVGTPDDGALRAEMRSLKQQLREAVGKAWLESLPESKATDNGAASAPTNLQWYAQGKGIAAEATPAGEFAVATEGKDIIARIHPRGWFSDLISTKDAAVLVSPRFKCDGGTLWMRAAGEGASRARYIVQNYPRTGTIHKAKEFKDDGDAVLGWRQLDLEYWKGDEIFVQCTTAADMPAEAKADKRSWYGITEFRITKKDDPQPPAPKLANDARAAVSAWIKGSMTDAQAELLDSLLHAGKLENDRRKIAAAEPLLAKYRALENRLPEPVRAPGVMEADATDRALFIQGNHKQPSELVPRKFMDAIDAKPFNAKNSGRLQLADSLADMQHNPLTARVLVNRLWQHLFGRGIVPTPDNFGRLGEPPSHPELLDFLAQRFIDSGGSIKDMIKLMVSSQTFQRSDRAPAGVAEKDPENKLLSHWTVRRLEAEAIRDSMLQLSGKLDVEMGGEAVPGNEPRRSVYVKVARNSLDPFLTVFDSPVPTGTRGKRDSTNVPAQSLTLLNDPRIQSWAAAWAAGVAKLPSDTARVEHLFVEAFGRKPSAAELSACTQFVGTSGHALDEPRRQLTELEAQSRRLHNQIESILTPVRDRLAKQLAAGATVIKGSVPEAFAEWDFETGPQDLKGRLPLTLHGNAKIDRGALVLDGKDAFARSVPLPKTLKAKTMEAWVLLDNLTQRGGGVITTQDDRGVVFDSIVFAEKAARNWVPGSDNFKRSQLLTGPAEDVADKQPVHMAIVYESDGTVTAYRNGSPYGEPYKSKGPAVFAANEAEIQLGCRHGSSGGNRLLTGRILRARVYDRALTAEEVRASSKLEQSSVNEHDVIDALTPAQRDEVAAKRSELNKLEEQTTQLAKQLSGHDDTTATWSSLALSLINAKEFIYLK